MRQAIELEKNDGQQGLNQAAAKARWSLAMYDGKTGFLVDNPIRRYLLNSMMLPHLKRSADAESLSISSTTRPGQAKRTIGCHFEWAYVGRHATLYAEVSGAGVDGRLQV